ncbi:YeeE/YedE family protein [Leeia oryzae]|uniref:YeeE/YedE family protein n=1 Tax=Leeia oryzae TaxID=356662 RepID=UPI00036DEFC9|nr:YeeE/YedE family protein [Leeia oryzae]
MQIDGLHFSPLASLFGGLLIGLAATLLLLFNGRIAGISGILGNLLKPSTTGRAWLLCFVLGLIVSPLVYRLFHALPASSVLVSDKALIIGGLLVGFGTRLGYGCTSGHGVCGIARFSGRSILATLCFMLAGFVTVFVVRHILGGV